MKKLSYLFILLFAFAACTQDKKENVQEDVENVETNEIEIPKPAEIADVPWVAEIDSTTQKISMQANDLVNPNDLDYKNVIAALNKRYPETKLVWEKQLSDTAYVAIPDANYLTQGSGSMGAEIMMAEMVYSLTQIPGIKFVKIQFKQGDHAAPGTFSRTDFTFSK